MRRSRVFAILLGVRAPIKLVGLAVLFVAGLLVAGVFVAEGRAQDTTTTETTTETTTTTTTAEATPHGAVGTWAAQGWALERQTGESAVLRRGNELMLVSVDQAGHVSTQPLSGQ
jgi:hypothetical protein